MASQVKKVEGAEICNFPTENYKFPIEEIRNMVLKFNFGPKFPQKMGNFQPQTLYFSITIFQKEENSVHDTLISPGIP